MAAFKAFFRMYFRGFDASNQALISLLKKPVRYICLVILVQSFPEILAKALAMRPWTF